MILDKDIPVIGGGKYGRSIARAFAGVQETLLRGSPLLVDDKGRPATKLRTGGLASALPDWGDLLDHGRILDKDGNRFPGGWTPPAALDDVPAGGYIPMDHWDDAERYLGFDRSTKPEALVFAIDFVSTVEWLNRADLPKPRRLDRIRWWFESRWYRIEEALEADIRSGREIWAWLRSSWEDRPWKPETGGLFWSQDVEDDVRAQIEGGQWEGMYDDSPPGRFAGAKHRVLPGPVIDLTKGGFAKKAGLQSPQQ